MSQRSVNGGRQRLLSPIFIDASAWLASVNGRDQHYATAHVLLAACFAQRVELVTTNWTAYEALSILKSRVGPKSAEDLWALISNNRSIALIDVTADIERRARELFFGYRDKTWGMVDCASLVVMQDVGCRQAFGFDHHFIEASRQRGFELIPSDG
ncbi:MAG: type II toxin-antitoxin system VapC family toxin [Thermomicrobiales bacterium]